MGEQQTILGRVSQLVRANVNELIDHAEDPGKMTAQLVRDYTNQIAEVQTAVAQAIGNVRMTEGDRDNAAGAAADWGSKGTATSRKADAATDPAEKDRLNGLARIAFGKQIIYEAQAKTLGTAADAGNQQADALKEGLRKMESTLDTLKSKRDELAARSQLANAQVTVQRTLSSVSVTDPTSELSRFEDKVRRQEALATGMAEVAGSGIDQQFATLDDDANSAEVEERLAASKVAQPA